MEYTYILKTKISRFNENDQENPKITETPESFKHINPLNARQMALSRAKSFIEVINSEEPGMMEEFFGATDKDGLNKEYEVTVLFVHPDTGKEFEIHNSELTRGMPGDAFDGLRLRWVITALEAELKVLREKGLTIPNIKNIEITFLPSNEKLNATIIPTDWINITRITAQDLL